MDDGFSFVLLCIDIVEPKTGGLDVVLDAIGNRQHQGIGIGDTDNFTVVIHADIKVTAFGRIEKGHHLFFKRVA